MLEKFYTAGVAVPQTNKERFCPPMLAAAMMLPEKFEAIEMQIAFMHAVKVTASAAGEERHNELFCLALLPLGVLELCSPVFCYVRALLCAPHLQERANV